MSFNLRYCLCEVKHINARLEKSGDVEVPAIDLKLEIGIEAFNLEEMLPGKSGYSLVDALWDADGDIRWPQLEEIKIDFRVGQHVAQIDDLVLMPVTLHKVKIQPEDHNCALMTCALTWFATGEQAATLFERFLGRKARFTIAPIDHELDFGEAA